jgi:lipopolysaccharide biosynthesis regulator YciM
MNRAESKMESGAAASSSSGGAGSSSAVTTASSLFAEALQHDPQNTRAMTALARIAMQKGDRDGCIAQCNKVRLGTHIADWMTCVEF